MTRRASRFAVVSALSVFALAGVAVPGVSPPASAATSAADPGVTKTQTITRTQLDPTTGAELPAGSPGVESRVVTVTVDRTQNLRSRQSVAVTWQGAHPTANPTLDVTSSLGATDEFPFVLLQCRGTDDSPSLPASERLSPQTCWTQTAGERMHQKPPLFPAWRVDRYADAADRAFRVNDPSTFPPDCNTSPSEPAFRVPFVSADGTTYLPTADPRFCSMQQPPETLTVENDSLPGNTTYGITGVDGTGDAKFVMKSAQDNASLGCSESVKCSLVAVPILGVSCDVAAKSLPVADRPTGTAAVTKAEQDCQSTGNYVPGEGPSSGKPPALSVSGNLWWTASNWRNKITFPLTFAPADNVCDLVGAKEPVVLFGSELMTQAMSQWQPAFCLDPKRTPFRHAQTGEPQAANLLAQSSIEAALVTDGPDGGYTHPVVSAPVAFSGFAISYAIDDAQKRAYTKLRLTPRLIAKLLTMSYPGNQAVQAEYPALHDNPLDVSMDPEFQVLNPAIKHGVPNEVSASTIFSLSSDSDVIRSLTTYLNSDPEARSWLDGAPDPWGMKVNPNYAKIALPVQTWPQLDSFQPKIYYATGNNPCLQDSPVPFLPLIASPTIRMSSISFAMQFAISTSQVICSQPSQDSRIGQKLVGGGRQAPGGRFDLGLTSIGDAARFQLDTAALETTVAPSTAAKFTSDTGRTFVAPTDAGLRAAGALLTPNVKSGAWDLPMARILKDSKAAAAYPGAMVIYAAVPTLGLPAADAQAYADLLRWAVTTGQIPGTTNGTLPAGFLPLTAANGLQSLASFTTRAASAVAAQKGDVPSIVPPPTVLKPKVTTKPSATPGAGGPIASGGLSLPQASGGSSSPAPAASAAKPGATVKPGSAVPTVAAKASPKLVASNSISPKRLATVGQDIGLAATLARILLLVALVLGGIVPLVFGVRRLRSRVE